MTLEVKTVTTQIDKYRGKQAESFTSLNTIAADWEVCEITGLVSGEIPVYELPAYDEATPYYDRLVQKIGSNAAIKYVQQLGWEGFMLCQLCGCPRVKYPCPIKCDSKKLLMLIGSECVTNFMDADEKVTRQVKVFREGKIRELFNNWVYNGIQQCLMYQIHGKYIDNGFKRLIRKLYNIEVSHIIV